jgi:hypothetical protein
VLALDDKRGDAEMKIGFTLRMDKNHNVEIDDRVVIV